MKNSSLLMYFCVLLVTICYSPTSSSELYSKVNNIPVYEKHHLIRILGKENFQGNWMSNERPHKIFEAPVKNEASETLRILASYKSYKLYNETGEEINTDAVIRDAMQRWMLDEASCSTEFYWNYNDRHWPVWHREGMCNQYKTCSWPPGMRCRSDQSRHLSRLVWTCHQKHALSLRNHMKNQFMKYQSSEFDQRRRHKSLRSLRQWPRSADKSRRDEHDLEYRKKMEALVSTFLTSKYANGSFCYWKKQNYKTTETCKCTC